MRLKMCVALPEHISNRVLSSALVDECKNFEATWLTEKEAVFSVDNSEKELKKILGSWGINVIDKNCEHITHSRQKGEIKNNKKIETITPHKVIKKL